MTDLPIHELEIKFCSLPSLTLTPSQCPFLSIANRSSICLKCGSRMCSSRTNRQTVGRPERRQYLEWGWGEWLNSVWQINIWMDGHFSKHVKNGAYNIRKKLTKCRYCLVKNIFADVGIGNKEERLCVNVKWREMCSGRSCQTKQATFV